MTSMPTAWIRHGDGAFNRGGVAEDQLKEWSPSRRLSAMFPKRIKVQENKQ
jgi:hypothetical protein